MATREKQNDYACKLKAMERHIQYAELCSMARPHYNTSRKNDLKVQFDLPPDNKGSNNARRVKYA
jgi:hypothetical protein